METIKVRGTEKSPKFIFEPANGSIKILGRSTMESPQEFYSPIISMLKKYAASPAEKTHLFIDLEYYNTTSSKYMLSLLKLISRINHQPNKEAKIIWYFEEDDYGIRSDIDMFSNIIAHKIHAIEYEMAY